MESTTNPVLRLVRLELGVFTEAKRLRKQLEPVIKFKTLSAFFAHVLEVFKTAPQAPQTSPERLMILELRQGIYDRLGKLEELLVAQAASKTVNVTIDTLVGEISLPEPQEAVADQVTKALTDAVRNAELAPR